MQIYSWNVLCYNRRFDDVCAFIKGLDFDVLCLQEVTPELLECLQALPYEIAYHTDVIRLFSPSKEELNYAVILSKHPIKYRGTLQFPDFRLPLHTRWFITFMRLFRWSYVTERGAVYADITFGTQTIRVFSVHLTLWGPHNREAEFDLVTEHLPKEWPVVIAGDFNVIEFGPMKILNWLLGAPIAQGMPWYPERMLFEERFAKRELQNPLRGQVTHDFSRSQLDHILISDGVAVVGAHVVPELHGSDHHPVSVTLQL